MKVYLAGPMRGIPYFNFPAFHEAQALLAYHGFDVFNPARRDEEAGLVWSECPEGSEEEMERQCFDISAALLEDIQYVMYEAEAVVLLDGWNESDGAVTEASVASMMGKKLFSMSADGELHEVQLFNPRYINLRTYFASRFAWLGAFLAHKLHPAWQHPGDLK